MNLYQTFKEAAFRYPRKTAVVQGKQAVSYQELEAIVSGIASDLRQLGVAPGQMIGLCFGNSIAYIALTHALWRLDAAVVPVDAESKPEKIRRICEQMQLDGMIQQSNGDAGWIPGKCPVIGTGYYFRGLQQQSFCLYYCAVSKHGGNNSPGPKHLELFPAKAHPANTGKPDLCLSVS